MERLGRGDRLRRRLIKDGRRCGADHRRESAKSRKHRKTNKKVACAMGMRQKEIEKSKKREYNRGKRNANERRQNGKPGGDAGLGNKSGGAAPRRDRQPRSDNGERIAGTEKANA